MRIYGKIEEYSCKLSNYAKDLICAAKIVPRSNTIIIVIPPEVILEFSDERFIINGTHFTEIY